MVRLGSFTLLACILTLSLFANFTYAAGDPTGTTYSGKGNDKDKSEAEVKAKKDSRNSAERACKNFCHPKTVCGWTTNEPGLASCSNVGTTTKPNYECTLSATETDTNFGCKLTSCTCCSFSADAPTTVRGADPITELSSSVIN